MLPSSLLSFFSAVNKIKVATAIPNGFSSPIGDTPIHAGQMMELTWEEPSGATADLILMKGDPYNLETVVPIAMNIPNQGSAPWRVPADLAPGKYTVQIYASDGNMNYSPFFTVYDPVSPVNW